LLLLDHHDRFPLP